MLFFPSFLDEFGLLLFGERFAIPGCYTGTFILAAIECILCLSRPSNISNNIMTTASSRKSWKDLHLGEEALGGLSAGIIGTVIGFPLDTVKTRMQTSQASTNHGILHVARSVIQKEGFAAMYKGIGPPLISLSVLGTLTFTQYSYFQEVYQANPGWDARNFLAGISCSPVAGMVSTIENLVKVCQRVVMYPLDDETYSYAFDHYL